MKRKLGLLLVVLLLLTVACSSKEALKTEEELRKEIRAELEAEAKLKEEIRKKMEEEQKTAAGKENSSQSEEEHQKPAINQNFENGIEFNGKIVCNEEPYFVMLKNNSSKAKVNGKEYTYIALETDIISKYISRDKFLYHVKGFPMIVSDDYLYMAIEFDPSTAYESMDYLVVKDYRIIEPNLKDYSNEPYPITYYQDVIKTLCVGIYGAVEADVKKNPGYENNTDFKEAVDKVLSKGYVLVQNNEYYKVVNENAYNIDHMPTVNEICDIIGINVNEINTTEINYTTKYASEYFSDEIIFSIGHNKELKGTDLIDCIVIRGFDYTLKGIGLGDNVLNAYNKIAEKYDKLYTSYYERYEDYVFNVDGYAFRLNNLGYKEENDNHVDKHDLVREIKFDRALK